MRAERLSASLAALAVAFAPVASAEQPTALATAPIQRVATPEDLFGPLYRRVELERLFSDSKTFADAAPRTTPDAVMRAYAREAPATREALMRFVLAHFVLPASPHPSKAPETPAGQRAPLALHIARLWPQLTRPPVTPAPGGSQLALPRPFVVPGGRFRELYYWDSYFTMLGLKADGRNDLVESMIDDFGSLIDRYGHIPNGARTYYVSRSQPPFFYAMVGLSSSRDPVVKARRLRWLKAEHGWWMAGADALKPGEAAGHVVRLADGSVLNRPFDARDTPRDESYAEDVALAAATPARAAPQLYRDLRAGAETGWDYSSRWLADGRTLGSIHTTDIVPVDLNSLLYAQERMIAARSREAGDEAGAQAYDRMATARASAMRRYLWDGAAGVFRDYDWRAGRRTPVLSAAALYPLFAGLATPQEARATAQIARARLLAPGGLRTTEVRTGQQWDTPNGWAPLQWVAVSGLQAYGQDALAQDIACRWRATVDRNYQSSGRLLEKYDVEEAAPGGGGEYPLQDGFGWTNGVALALIAIPCTHKANP